MNKLTHYFKSLHTEWSLDGNYDSPASFITHFFRAYIGPFWIITIIFTIFLSLFIQQYFSYTDTLEVLFSNTALSSIELQSKIAELNSHYTYYILFLFISFFIIVMINIQIFISMIYTTADLVTEGLKFSCINPGENSKIKCAFARLNYMIGAIKAHHQLIQDYQEDLLQKNKTLDANEQNFRDVINTSPDAILVMDKKGQFIQNNKTAMDMFGYSNDEFTMLTPYDLASDAFKIEDVMNQAQSEFECICNNKKGEEFMVQIRLKHLENSNEENILAIIRDITKEQASKEIIEESLSQKELLLREIHHRVKNNMQIISSMLGMQALHNKDTTITKILESSQNRIKAMMLIHEKLYETSDINAIDFHKYLKDLIQNLYSTNFLGDKNISYTIDADELSLDTDTSLYCGLIINELVTNAFKYAFADKEDGVVRISLHVDNNNVMLSVDDNGSGFKEGYDESFTKTLGLRLVNKLVKYQLKGSLEHINSKEGSCFKIRFTLLS